MVEFGCVRGVSEASGVIVHVRVLLPAPLRSRSATPTRRASSAQARARPARSWWSCRPCAQRPH